HDHDHAAHDHDHATHDHDHATHAHDHAAHDHDREHAAHDHAHGGRAYREIRTLLASARLRPRVRERAERIFQALATAEARVHACEVDDVHFHEVGALDAIVDVIGTAIALEHFAVERIYVSPLPLGSGITRSLHGRIPVPAPATLELLRGFPTRPEDGDVELVTPTGAAILAALATPGPAPALVPLAIGYGAGDRELADRPNLLRVVLAEPAPAEAVARPSAVAQVASPALEQDEMVVIEANIDDMNPELFEAAIEALFAAGARDVSLSPITMKRGRPGTLLRLIGDPADAERLSEAVLRETTTIGVRQHTVTRRKLPRERRSVATRFGSIDVKEVALPDGTRRITPEYAQCQRAAKEHGVPVGAVYEETLRKAWGAPA
ncbi:MAG: nickel pincer cofactor biosynthesis protein LarC, partial [Deltaproteobacteria bacterium]|nr:nickel pincer cofactor biosynthesis protein LarC [Deltaproteobacteria bacterium]